MMIIAKIQQYSLYVLTVLAIAAASFLMGMNYAQKSNDAKLYKSLIENVDKMQQKSIDLYEKSLEFEKQKKDLSVKNRKLEKELGELLKRDIYQETQIEDDVFNKLNEILK